MLDMCPIRRRQLRRAARVREFSCRRNDCSAKGYAPTSCNNSRFQLHNSFIGNQNSNKLFAEFSKYENLLHKMKLSIRRVLVTWIRHPVFNSLYCFKNSEGEVIMAQVTLWGSVNRDGVVLDGSGGFAVKRESTGTYQIKFSVQFTKTPAVVGSQGAFGNGQSTLDNVIFPVVHPGEITVQTGDQYGKYSDRNFSFIVIGTIA
ncbi:hypothetical protein [Burkholderia ubonensis]|uniref:hypothetical protein n=2 Tax=Burkholderia ubonensis TaxID=101571 RepID=UPI001E2DEDFB|nr:hypothetical protein [Burkholderia ubonensis]